jgi:hypothetical protein
LVVRHYWNHGVHRSCRLFAGGSCNYGVCNRSYQQLHNLSCWRSHPSMGRVFLEEV